jgi:hypothetical protein
MRNTDWSEFMTWLDEPQRYVVTAMAEGLNLNAQTGHLRVSPPAVCSRRETIAKRAKAFWGEGVLAEVQEQPLWRRQAEHR